MRKAHLYDLLLTWARWLRLPRRLRRWLHHKRMQALDEEAIRR